MRAARILVDDSSSLACSPSSDSARAASRSRTEKMLARSSHLARSVSLRGSRTAASFMARKAPAASVLARRLSAPALGINVSVPPTALGIDGSAASNLLEALSAETIRSILDKAATAHEVTSPPASRRASTCSRPSRLRLFISPRHWNSLRGGDVGPWAPVLASYGTRRATSSPITTSSAGNKVHEVHDAHRQGR